MSRAFLSKSEGDELKRLYEEFAAATNHACKVLASDGMDSVTFLAADKKTGVLWRRIRELTGTANTEWMA